MQPMFCLPTAMLFQRIGSTLRIQNMLAIRRNASWDPNPGPPTYYFSIFQVFARFQRLPAMRSSNSPSPLALIGKKFGRIMVFPDPLPPQRGRCKDTPYLLVGGCISPLSCGRGCHKRSDVAGEGDLKPHFMTDYDQV